MKKINEIKYSKKYKRTRYKKRRNTVTDYLRPHEIPMFFDPDTGIIDNMRDWILCAFMCFCGLRRVETVGGISKHQVDDPKRKGKKIWAESTHSGIWVDDINFEESTILVHGKGHRDRTVSIPDHVMTRIHLYLSDPQDKDEFGNYKNGPLITRSSTIFHKLAGERAYSEGEMEQISIRRVNQIVRKYRETANFPRKLTPHMFRHTYAMELLRRNVPLNTVMENMGHTSINSTQKYIHALDREQRMRETREKMSL